MSCDPPSPTSSMMDVDTLGTNLSLVAASHCRGEETCTKTQRTWSNSAAQPFPYVFQLVTRSQTRSLLKIVCSIKTEKRDSIELDTDISLLYFKFPFINHNQLHECLHIAQHYTSLRHSHRWAKDIHRCTLEYGPAGGGRGHKAHCLLILKITMNSL